MIPNEWRFVELKMYIENPHNRRFFPRCVAARKRELKQIEEQIKNNK